MSRCKKSARPEQNRQTIEDFVSRLIILQYGDKAAQYYGETRSELEKSWNINWC